MLSMKDLIGPDKKQILYKDECGDDFVLTRTCEIFVKSDDTLGVTAFKNGAALKRFLSGKLEDFFITDDNLYHFIIKIENLPLLIGKDSIFKTRMVQGSKRMKELEERLGHRILNFKPKLEK